MTLDLFAEIERITELWKLTHTTNAAAARTPRADSGSTEQCALESVSESAPAPLTFAQIGLGEEFRDRDGNVWEKRTERRAISWHEFERPEWAEFLPDEPVERV